MMQLGLLYTFCQELPRRFPGANFRTLYRGTHDPEEYAVHATDADGARPKTVWVQLNHLNSVTANRETAWEFGSPVWEVQVPQQKIVFFSRLLPRNLLEGETEYLVLGGEYRVRPLRF